jgi:hypothetical protein
VPPPMAKRFETAFPAVMEGLQKKEPPAAPPAGA